MTKLSANEGQKIKVGVERKEKQKRKENDPKKYSRFKDYTLVYYYQYQD